MKLLLKILKNCLMINTDEENYVILSILTKPDHEIVLRKH